MATVLITGASSGIGLQLANDYAEDGWQVIACGRDANKLASVFSASTNIQTCVFDIADRSQAEVALAELGALDLAILNAGSCEYIDDAKHFDAELFERVIVANVIGTANCIAPLLANMRAGSRLAIVSSSVTFVPLTRAEAYGASKAALNYLAETLAIDLAKHGIAVSLIKPGFVDTPLTRKNTFSMPGIVSQTYSSRAIRNGLAKGRSHISFPFGFITALKTCALLPHSVWRKMAVKMVGKTQ